MSYQQHPDRGGPYGKPNNDMSSQPGQRPPPGNYPPSNRQRGPPPPMRPGHAGGGPPGGRPPMRPPPLQYARPREVEPTENLYDGSAYGGADEGDQWPLPARPFAQPGRSNSPGGSPRGSPRKPPQRPQRPDYQEPILDPPRPAGRIAPANRAYHQPPPPQQSYHGSGQWTGEGYRSTQPPRPPPNPPRMPAPSRGPPSEPMSNSTYQQIYPDGARPGPPPQQVPQEPITDYQTPQAIQQAVYGARNQRPPLGPPPSARRGPATYYPQIAPVHPIAEETDSVRGSIRNASVAFDPAHSSYASSNAIPIGIPGYYLDDHRGSSRSLPSDHSQSRRPSADQRHYDESPIEPIYENDSGRDMESPSPEPAALIRQASLGKKSKPTLTTVKSGDSMRRKAGAQGLAGLPSQQRGLPSSKENLPALDKETTGLRPSVSSSGSDSNYDDKALEAGGAAALGAAVAGTAALFAGRKDSRENAGTPRTPSSDILSSGTGLLDPSSSESEKEVKKKPSKELLGSAVGKEQEQRSKARSPLAPVDPRIESVRGGLEKGGALSPTDSEQVQPPTGAHSEPVGRKRRPRLNVDMDAVREAEARGSMTSLTDLIRRATRLASNLDRGKTASRLGMNFFTDGSESDQERWRGLGANDNRRSGSISDILSSFPPPGMATPPDSRDGVRRSLTQWNSNLRHSHLPSDSDAGEIRKKRKRKCCGMSLWLFILLLIVVFLLVAAAVVVPVILLIVIPDQKNGNSSGSVDVSAKLASCQRKLHCSNGGTNIISSDGSCRCLCVNSYTGSTCTVKSEAGCTTVSVGSTTDATMGEDIPRLLKAAASNFGIPLDGQTLLGLFSSAGMSCNTENALVTFNNVASRSTNHEKRAPAEPPRTTKHQRAGTATKTSAAATTSNSIVHQSGTPTASAKSPSSPSSSSSTTLDFARVAILYIFQDSNDADTAATAQQNLQYYFSTGETSSGQKILPKHVSLGNGYSCDLPARSLSLSNGTTIGG